MEIKPVLIMPTAITVSARRTRLTSERVRLRLLFDSIKVWRFKNPGIRIVVCDGSGFDLNSHASDYLNGDIDNLEFISFTNNEVEVERRGKGFGEGEIIAYVLKQSMFMSSSSHFAKCTGRLWVDNYQRCLSGFNGEAGFDYQGKLGPSIIDTRFYICSTEFYKQNIRNLHIKVNEDAGKKLEHLFCDFLCSLSPRTVLLPTSPLICGVSGSMAVPYSEPSWKSVMKSARNRLSILAGRYV